MTHLEKHTLDFWHVSKTFHDPSNGFGFTVEIGLQYLGGIIGAVSTQKKVWTRCTRLQDNIICNNREAK